MKKLIVLLLVVAMSLAADAAMAHLTGQKICIDPGHGGSDPGAVGQGLYEKTINLDIGLRARDLMQLDAATVVMTRTTDVYVTLQGRCDIANNAGANRFECTHCNAFNGTVNGTETFCHPNETATGYDLRNKVNPEMVAHMGTYNRGLKTNTFYVLAYTNMAAILCEVAFIDNAADAAKLANPAYRQEAARAYLHGTQSHYGIAPHDPATDIIIDNPSATFVGSWSTGTSSTDKYGADYRYCTTATTETKTATWTPNIAVAGNYNVYVWYPQGSNRSAIAPFTTYWNGGSQTVAVNQKAGGGTWNLLVGNKPFAAGTGGYVKLGNGTGEVSLNVMADAIKFVKL